MIERYRWKVVEVVGIAIAMLLPLYFNPFSGLLMETSQTQLFQSAVFGMLLVLLFSYVAIQFSCSQGLLQTIRSIQIRQILSDHIVAPITAYSLLLLLATAFSISPAMSLWSVNTQHGVVTTLCAILFSLTLIRTLQSWAQIERLVTAILIGSVAVTFYGWIQYLGWDSANWRTDSVSPIQSILGRSVFLGTYLIMIIPLTLARTITLFQQHNRRVIVYLLILLLQVGCLVLTLARGAWLGFMAGLVLFVWLMAKEQLKIKQRIFPYQLLVVGIIVVGLILFATLYFQGKSLFLSTTWVAASPLLTQYRSDSNWARLSIWSQLLPMIAERPIIGYGPATYLLAYANYYPANPIPMYDYILMGTPHNMVLEQLLASGILGLSAFGWIIVRFYARLIQALAAQYNRTHRALISAILTSVTGYLIQAQFTPDVLVSIVFFWIFLALGMAMTNLAGRTHPLNKESSAHSSAESMCMTVRDRDPVTNHLRK